MTVYYFVCIFFRCACTNRKMAVIVMFGIKLSSKVENNLIKQVRMYRQRRLTERQRLNSNAKFVGWMNSTHGIIYNPFVVDSLKNCFLIFQLNLWDTGRFIFTKRSSSSCRSEILEWSNYIEELGLNLCSRLEWQKCRKYMLNPSLKKI